MDNLCSMCGHVGHIRANCPRNLEARTRCGTCHKIGHYTTSCPKNRYCGYCDTWGHRGYACTDPHRFCQEDRRCPVPASHPYSRCPRPFEQDDPWADYDGQYDVYDDIDWEAQDRSP